MVWGPWAKCRYLKEPRPESAEMPRSQTNKQTNKKRSKTYLIQSKKEQKASQSLQAHEAHAGVTHCHREKREEN